MCAAGSGRANIPSLFRQRSIDGGYVLIDEQPHSLARADPAFFPRGMVNGAFHQKTFAVDTSSTASSRDDSKKSDARVPPPVVENAVDEARSIVQNQYGPLETFSLHNYIELNHDQGTGYYIQIMIVNQSLPNVPPFVYVLVNPLARVPRDRFQLEYVDFLNKFTQSNDRAHLIEATTSVSCSRWTTVTRNQPVPADITTATLIARHYVRAQHGKLSTYMLMAYKKISRENGFAKDFFMKINIGSNYIFVKLSADHHGGADNVETAKFDFSPECSCDSCAAVFV